MPARQTLDIGLLRGILRMDTEPEIDLLTNLNALRTEVKPLGIDAHLLTFIGHQAERSGQIPTFALVFSEYDRLAQAGNAMGHPGLIRLNEIQQTGVPFWGASDYRYHLDQYREEVMGDLVADLIQQASVILTTGYTPPALRGQPTKPLQGPSAAQEYVLAGIAAIENRFSLGTVTGEFRLDAAGMWSSYEARQGQDQTGVLSGYEDIDLAHNGLQRGDLAFVMGFPGHFKSTFCFNWAYHAAVYGGHNVAICSIEVGVEALKQQVAVMHAHHPRFDAAYPFHNLTYDAYRRGTLTPQQEALMQEALTDLHTNPTYGVMVYQKPSHALTVRDVKQWAEAASRYHGGLDLLVLDYIGLINPSTGGDSIRESSNLNAAIAEAKKLATGFDNGRGIPVLSPFQASREGFKEAEKNKGIYTLRALSWANEAERASDFVYSVYADTPMRQARQLKIGNLKARDRPLVTREDLLLFCDPATRVIADANSTTPAQTPVVPPVVPPPPQPAAPKKGKKAAQPPP